MKVGQVLGSVVLTVIGLVAVAGCARRNASVSSAFPRAALAAPWLLEGEVWSGSFEEAASALGDDADEWRALAPTLVWLAVYRHEHQADRKLTVRAFAFDTVETARQAFTRFRPLGATEFRAGDEGCWTGIGVMFRWGRLIFDIFAPEASWQNEMQAALLANFVQNLMPPARPLDPR